MKPMLLSIKKPCPDSKIKNSCGIFRDICAALDALTGI
jgi:hypothetical protein